MHASLRCGDEFSQASLVRPAAAQERVAIGTQRLPDNGALFLAAAAGYFKARASTLR